MLNRQLSVNLYRHVIDGNADRPMEMWHCSSLSECPKAQYMKRKSVPTLSKPTGALVLRWASGHAVEKAIRPYIEKEYRDSEANVRLTSKKLDMTGEYDNYDKASKRIIEIKSVHDMAFIEKNGVTGLKEQIDVWEKNSRWAGKAKWALKENPYLHHEVQNHAYVLLLEEQGIEVTHIDYVYISLSGRIVTYTTEVDMQGDVMRITKERIKLLNEAWKNQTPPECICKVNGQDNTNHPLWNSVLKYCPYNEGEECCNYKEGEK